NQEVLGFYFTKGVTLSFLSYFLPIANDKALVFAFKDLLNCLEAAGMKQDVLCDHFQFCITYDLVKLDDLKRIVIACENEKEIEIADWLKVALTRLNRTKENS